MTKTIDWVVTSQDGRARTGTLRTRRSIIETPVFMPVGTQGTVKGVRFEWLEDEMDARIILGNTYHLFLRPGPDVVRKMGGLHRFSTWNRSLLTDSGGFQIFSLTDLRKLTEEGVEFRSHLDGSKKFLSPEVSMEVQAALGSEIVMAFDECPPGDGGHERTKQSLELTIRWAERSKKRFNELQKVQSSSLPPLDKNPAEACTLNGKQALFGIIQGAGHLDLRDESLEQTVGIGFDGYAIGGLSVGEEKPVMYGVLDHIVHKMPGDAPRYLMGVGTPEDLVEAVYRGVDMFDCVMPTRNGRTGGVFTWNGKLNVRNAQYTTDDSPLDANCTCSVCRRYSRAYLRHLYQAGEILAATLISHHNLAFYLDLMRRIRAEIKAGTFENFRKDFLDRVSKSEK